MALLQYSFEVVGVKAIERAFNTIEKRAAQHNQRMARVFGQSPSARTKQLDPAKESKLAQRVQDRQLQRQLRDEQRLHREKLRNIEREAKAKITAERRVRQISKRQEQLARRDAVEASRRGSSVVGALGKGTGTLRSLAMGGVGMLGLGGGLAFGGALQAEIRDRAAASRFANMAGQPGKKADYLAQARQVKGVQAHEVLAGAEQFGAATGSYDLGMSMAGDLSKLAVATNTDLTEMNEAAGRALPVIADTIEGAENQRRALMDVMQTLAGMGNVGAVEIKDMAKEMATLSAATRAYKGDADEMIKTVAAMSQAAVARGGAASAAEASTSVVRFASDIIKNQADLGKMGINVFADEGKTTLRSAPELMADIMDKTQGDLTKLEPVFGEYGARAMRGMSPLYMQAQEREAIAAKKEGRDVDKDAGRKAIMAEFKRLMGATVTDKEIQQRFDSRMQDTDMQLQQAMQEFNAAVGSELLPAVTKLIPELTKLTPTFAKAARALTEFVSWFADNPFSGMGAIIAASVAKDIAAAQIGEVLKASLAGEMGKASAGGSLFGTISKLTLTAATAYIAYEVGKEWIDSTIKGGEESRQAVVDPMQDAVALTNFGGSIAEKEEAAKRLRESLEKQKGPTTAEMAISGIAKMFDKDAPTAVDQHFDAREKGFAALDALEASIVEDKLQAAINGKVLQESAQALKESAQALKDSAATGPNRTNGPTVPKV